MDIGREKKTIKFLCGCGTSHESRLEVDHHELHDCSPITPFMQNKCSQWLEVDQCDCLKEYSLIGYDKDVIERIDKVYKEKSKEIRKKNSLLNAAFKNSILFLFCWNLIAFICYIL